MSEMPTEVLMEFKGDIRLVRVAITHASSGSMDMDLGGQTAFTKEFRLPMHDMGAGVVSSSGECAIALVAQKAINPESRKFFIFFPILLKIS